MALKIVERSVRSAMSDGNNNDTEMRVLKVLQKYFPGVEITQQPPTVEYFPKYRHHPARSYTADYHFRYRNREIYLEYKPPGKMQVYNKWVNGKMVQRITMFEAFKYEYIDCHFARNDCLFDVITYKFKTVYLHGRAVEKDTNIEDYRRFLDRRIDALEHYAVITNAKA